GAFENKATAKARQRPRANRCVGIPEVEKERSRTDSCVLASSGVCRECARANRRVLAPSGIRRECARAKRRVLPANRVTIERTRTNGCIGKGNTDVDAEKRIFTFSSISVGIA